MVGTATNSTKVLTSGNVIGKPLANWARQEWMQRRKNRYKSDKSGDIIDTLKENEDGKLKGKITEDAVVTKNNFDALEVEKIDQPTLRITVGKGEGNGKDQQKKRHVVEAKKVQEKEQLRNIDNLQS